MSLWSNRIEAAAATVTALVAVMALIGVKVQLDANDTLQSAQSARDAYRAHLALAATLPQFAQPADGCALLGSDRAGGYVAFVDHLLYSAEQMLVVGDGWEPTFLDALIPHQAYICTPQGPPGATDETHALLSRFRKQVCPDVPAC